jgi:Uma2 family endonuclease
MGVLNPSFQVTLEQFQALREERPKEEKWELIGGTPVMMPPPTLMHQRVAGNLARLLEARLAAAEPSWHVDREVGVLLIDDDRFCPEPDVLVIDKAFELGQIYAPKFYFVAEVLSENDRPRVLALKREFYTGHAACRAVMFVRQDRIEAELVVRGANGWSAHTLTDPVALIAMPDIGTIGALADLYRDTPLAPKN